MTTLDKMPTSENIIEKIFHFRGAKVMLDSDLASLYEVETKQLKRQVRRNASRFPEDFMFELNAEELKVLRSQFGTLKRGMHSKYGIIAFTEQGVAMLSSILNSEKAIQVNIEIIRIFSKIRFQITENRSLKDDIERIKNRLDNHDQNLEILFRYLDELTSTTTVQEPQPRQRIGFKPDII
ncbi:ORF6N domain-containing protein [Pedobacter sp. R-06]|uniref:ORF6N domain-containing protein n=1 Tax=Pedobacter sp. R-06 TaxID=3404051 RepID=UPI003CF7854B